MSCSCLACCLEVTAWVIASVRVCRGVSLSWCVSFSKLYDATKGRTCASGYGFDRLAALTVATLKICGGHAWRARVATGVTSVWTGGFLRRLTGVVISRTCRVGRDGCDVQAAGATGVSTKKDACGKGEGAAVGLTVGLAVGLGGLPVVRAVTRGRWCCARNARGRLY